MTDENLCILFSALLSGQATMLRVLCRKELSDRECKEVWDFAQQLEENAIVLEKASGQER